MIMIFSADKPCYRDIEGMDRQAYGQQNDEDASDGKALAEHALGVIGPTPINIKAMKMWPQCQDVCRGASNIGECQEDGRKGGNFDQSEGVGGSCRAG